MTVFTRFVRPSTYTDCIGHRPVTEKGEAIFWINFMNAFRPNFIFIYVFRQWPYLASRQNVEPITPKHVTKITFCSVCDLCHTTSVDRFSQSLAQWLNGKRKTNYLCSFTLVWCSWISFSSSSPAMRTTWIYCNKCRLLHGQRWLESKPEYPQMAFQRLLHAK